MVRLVNILVAILLLYGCSGLSGNSFSPEVPGYPLYPEKRILLKKQLREISGIYWHSGQELIAINDEEGVLFFVNPGTGDFRKIPFGPAGDYEDLVKTPGGFYILESNGTLHQLDSSGKEMAVFSKKFKKSIEFESLCYDAEKNSLLLICKSCGSNEPFIHAWQFDLETHTYLDLPEFSIPLTEIRKLGKDASLEFKPSAAAFHPVSGKLYLIASIGKILVQCSREGKAEAVFNLNPEEFPQPEGLCFTPTGDLYISNEGAEHKATLLYYPMKPGSNSK